MSFIPHPVFLLTGGLSVITQIASATSFGTNITAPADVQAGDLLVLNDIAVDGTLPSTVVPTGFNIISNITLAANRNILSYKLADGSEAGASLTGMAGASGVNKVLVTFRGDVKAAILTMASANGEATSGTPTDQSVTASSGVPPLVVLASYVSAASDVATRGFSTTKDGEVEANSTSGVLYDNWVAWKIYNSGPADTTISMPDGGNNYMCSCYIQMA